MTDLDEEIINEFQDNDEWDACFNAVDDWDREQDLIAKSNAIDEEAPKPEYLEVLHRCFGHKSFRPMQWKIISSIINDRRDNCTIMATGYGKSLCFQYPSVYIGGVTIVVSPLISLMEDQVLSMEMSNISACLLGSAQTNKKQVIEEIFENKYSLIYLTPELCCGDYGQYLLKRMDQNLSIVLIAIDEAHCVSSWGHDFRYQYRELGKIRDVLPNVPILAVTATATPKVRTDIISCLRLRNAQVLCSGFDRPNLQFSVYLKGSNGILADLRKVMTDNNDGLTFPGSTIIYCITRKQTEETATILKTKGIKCLSYHAGMTVKARKEAHEKFAKDKVKVIIATIAFGMGIDKPDVRNIIHYGASKDIESYYQEVGRAGRDGQPSNCFTFYNNGDFDLHQTIREMGGTTNQTNRNRREAMERIMVQYLESRDCRRQFILNHFEGSVSPKKPKPRCCDNCTRKLQQKVSDCNKYEGLNEQGLYDFTSDAHRFLAAVQTMNGKFGIGMYVLFLRGSKSSKMYDNLQKHPLNGSGKDKSADWWKAVGRLVEREGYLKRSVHKKSFKGSAVYSTYGLSDKAQNFLQKKGGKIMLQPPPEIFKLLKHKQQPSSPEEALFREKPLPSTSTSRTSTAFKPSLKLLKLASKTESKTNSDNQSESSENDVEKEERMKVYRLLMNKRADLASTVDCMPYMVASNEALMKMAQMKPLTIKELRNCQLEGFTEAKISRFGEQFVKTIRIICHLDPIVAQNQNTRSIQDILAENPLPGARIGATAEASYSMYKSGLTVQEIATKRGVIPATVLSHLTDAIKAGYPIKLIDLNVTDEMRDSIIDIIRNRPPSSDMTMTSIKNACPPDVSFDAIKVVMAYLQVRDHLSALAVAYVDFEVPIQSTAQLLRQQSSLGSESQSKRTSNRSLNFAAEGSQSGSSQSTNTQNTKSKLGSLISTKKCEKRDADLDSVDSFALERSSINPPKKKQKLKLHDSASRKSGSSDDLGFLDSPPRSTHKFHSQKMENRNLVVLESPPQTYTTNDRDLEKTLEDNFFDDALLDNVDKVISSSSSQSTSNKSIASGMERKSQEKQFFEPSPTTCELKNQNKLDDNSNASNSTATQQNKFKKFQFKSKVPQSVMESTKQLCLQQPIQHFTK